MQPGFETFAFHALRLFGDSKAVQSCMYFCVLRLFGDSKAVQSCVYFCALRLFGDSKAVHGARALQGLLETPGPPRAKGFQRPLKTHDSLKGPRHSRAFQCLPEPPGPPRAKGLQGPLKTYVGLQGRRQSRPPPQGLRGPCSRSELLQGLVLDSMVNM